MRQIIRPKSGRALALAAIGVLPLVASAASGPSSWTFNGGGNWTVASNWLGGVPGAGYDVFITHNDAINRTISYDYAGASIQFNSMTVNNTGVGSDQFFAAGKIFNTLTETIGTTGAGYWTNDGGTHNEHRQIRPGLAVALSLGNEPHNCLGAPAACFMDHCPCPLFSHFSPPKPPVWV